MKLTRLITAGVILPFLLALCVVTTGAAASGGTLVATDALEIKQGEDAHVLIFLNGSYDPAVKALQLKVHYDESVAEVTNFSLNEDLSNVFGTDELNNPRSGFKLALASGKRIPTGTWLWDITFTVKPEKNDGSRMEVGLELEKIGVSDDISYMSYTTVQNGTFTTKDEVAPVIDITTPATVSPTFNIAGTITEVGGMGTATATLKNATHAAVVYDLSLDGSAPDYTFNHQVTWPIEDGVTLTVTATDVAGNTATTPPQVINVVDVGFSKPEPTGYINDIPTEAQAFMSQMDKVTVGMSLGSATYGPISLAIDTSTDYAVGTISSALPDGDYWVNVSGTDKFGDERFLNWTFTLDQTAPVINTFTITDSDGDGYIEAGEILTLNWGVVADLSFDHVALVDKDTDEVLWCCDSLEGTEKVVIDVGNRDLEFRAYDLACNYAKREFHLYNNYMVWVNSTKMGDVSGLDTTYTAAKDISRTGVSSITLHNACTVPLPGMSTLERTVTNLGWVTGDTYVTADRDINRTLSGTETYQNAWVYDPDRVFDFTVKVPNTQKAVIILAEANESYIADLIEGGRSGLRSVDYMDLVEKAAYIFIDGGWTEVTIDDNGKVGQGDNSGSAVTISGDKSATAVLSHPNNQVDLSNCYKLSAQRDKDNKPLDSIILAPGDYALAAITIDGDRLGLLAAMPVIVMESGDQGAIDPVTVKQNETFTAQFTYDTPCERLGVVLLRDVTYEGTAFIDAAKLSKDKGTLKQALKLNITHGGIPATQKLIGNIYVSPSSGKYAVANTNKATISTSGLEPGSYHVYMIGQSKNGTVQAYGMHTLEITTETTPKPTPKPPSGGGGGGGGSSPTYTSYTGTGTLTVNNVGTVLRSIKVNADDKVGSLLVPIGVKALDKDGNPLTSITLTPLASDKMPAVPSGALFKFAGYVYEAGPDGATFEPGITLAFDLPADAWNALDPDNNDFKVKWYNEETEEWEDVPTTTYKSTRSVDAEITHFSTFALFTEPVTTPTETPTPPVDIDTPTTPPGDEKPPAGEFPTTIFAIVVVLVIVIAAGYFFIVRK